MARSLPGPVRARRGWRPDLPLGPSLAARVRQSPRTRVVRAGPWPRGFPPDDAAAGPAAAHVEPERGVALGRLGCRWAACVRRGRRPVERAFQIGRHGGEGGWRAGLAPHDLYGHRRQRPVAGHRHPHRERAPVVGDGDAPRVHRHHSHARMHVEVPELKRHAGRGDGRLSRARSIEADLQLRRRRHRARGRDPRCRGGGDLEPAWGRPGAGTAPTRHWDRGDGQEAGHGQPADRRTGPGGPPPPSTQGAAASGGISGFAGVVPGARHRVAWYGRRPVAVGALHGCAASRPHESQGRRGGWTSDLPPTLVAGTARIDQAASPADGFRRSVEKGRDHPAGRFRYHPKRR